MSNPIDSLLENNPSEFKESIYEALGEKLLNRLELEKVNVAQAMFGIQEEVDEDESEDEDEDFELNEDEDFEEEYDDEEGDFSDEDE